MTLGIIRLLRITAARLVSSGPFAAGDRSVVLPRTPLPPRRGARAAVGCFIVVFLGLHQLAGIAVSDARVRDPEYGRRVYALRKRIAENPGRPLFLVAGSSRVAMGVCPSEWEATRPGHPATPDPLLFNMAILGSGPIMELMVLRRVYAEGFRPAVVLLEYWPPFLHQDDEHHEVVRIARDRLMDVDRQLIREYFSDPVQLEAEMDWRQRHPLFGYREPMLGLVAPRWLLDRKRTDWSWENLDEWGWKPGADLKPDMAEVRAAAHKRIEEQYRPLFAAHRISPISDRAYRASVELARQHGAAVGLVFYPESSEFRGIYPEEVEKAAAAHLERMSRELDLPVINARHWLDDKLVVDGFHLSRLGAAEFTRKFGPALRAAFPQVKP
ncbi:MAG: hypothetical protein U0792_12140 [Gemmataceae bacterium]